MSTLFFLSDLHLGHESALVWARKWRDGETIEEHDQIIIDKINSRVKRRDHLYLLGDVTWRDYKLFMLDQIQTQNLYLIRGNHDDLPTTEYLKYFKEVYGIHKKKGYWLSHAPIHPAELRSCRNIHGHVHQNSIKQDAFFTETNECEYDVNYINVSVEPLDGYPISLEEIRDGTYYKIRRC